jgi:hypothetical protein
MLPHVSSLMPLSAKTLQRHCAMTQVMHDDVGEGSDHHACDDHAAPKPCDANVEEDQEHTGRIRNWFRKKFRGAMGIGRHHNASGHSAGVGGNSAPVTTTPKVAVADSGAQTAGAAHEAAERVALSETYDAPGSPLSNRTTPRANEAGPSASNTRAGAGVSSGHKVHTHSAHATTSTVSSHVTFSEGARLPPSGRSDAATDRQSPAARFEGEASPGSTGSAADRRGHRFVPKTRNGQRTKQVPCMPTPMPIVLDSDSKALCAIVAQGYRVSVFC